MERLRALNKDVGVIAEERERVKKELLDRKFEISRLQTDIHAKVSPLEKRFEISL